MTVQSSTQPRQARPPWLVPLVDPTSQDAALVGAKAANLAKAAAVGLPVLPGVTLTTTSPHASGATADGAVFGADLVDALVDVYVSLSESGRYRLVARSSSTVEDLGTSSMAGRFTSVLGIDSAAALVDAVHTVLASALGAAAVDGTEARPMAVLVQRELNAAYGGVLFGVDPLDAGQRHLLVELTGDGPDALVSGRALGSLATLNRWGWVVQADADARRLLSPAVRRGLARIARRARRHFGAPQDIEWAVDDGGRLWLLQTRPVTASSATAVAAPGPLLGPGPLGETFPLPLRPLEAELWLEPLRAGMVDALGVLGAVGRRRLERSTVVREVGGWAVCDLEILGVVEHPSKWRSLAPAPALRHLRAAWRVGALRATFSERCRELSAKVDADLAAVPDLSTLGERQLVDVIEATVTYGRVLHGEQMLAAILEPEAAGATLAAVATAALRSERAVGGTDAEIVARDPVVLGLVPPRIGGVKLPAAAPGSGPHGTGRAAALGSREALRLRVRLVQELAARAAAELGRRLFQAEPDAEGMVALLSVAELSAAVDGKPIPEGLTLRSSGVLAPVPAAFRLAIDGTVIPARLHARGRLGGRGASRGWATGEVVHADGEIGSGQVLVVRTLDPRLAPLLGRVAGVVAETGSVLSHLAILAREQRVPVVVGVEGACERFPAGSRLAIDGGTGEVRSVP